MTRRRRMAMERLAEAARVVGAARRRLVASRVLDGVARGATAGAVAGAAVWVVVPRAHASPLLAPLLGAALGAVAAWRRGVPADAAALELDAAANTGESFVSALTALD